MKKFFTIWIFMLMHLVFTTELLHSQDPGTSKEDSLKSNSGISGIVLDKDSNVPLASVSVQLLKGTSQTVLQGSETSQTGKFNFENLTPGTYSIKVEFVGYSSALLKGIIVNEGEVKVIDPVLLKSGSVTTEEITVEAEKSAIELKADKKVFNVEGNMITQGGSAVDVLKNIPSVNVDVDGNISLRGSQNVRIIVDGKPFGTQGANLPSLLEQIPANQIASIELITNPSAKYEAEGESGIINIITKKSGGFGYNGSFTLNAGTRDKYNGTINMNLRNDKVKMYGSYDYKLFNFIIQGNSNRENFVSTESALLSQQASGRVRNISHFAKTGLDYNFNKRSSISLSGNYTDRDRSRNESTHTTEFDVSNVLNTDYLLLYNEKTLGHNFDVALNYMLLFKNPKQTLTSDISFFNYKDNTNSLTEREYTLPENNTPPQQYQTILDDNYETNAQIDYTHPFSEDSKLESGYKGIFRKSDKDFNTNVFDYTTNSFVLDPALTNRFVYDENIQAAYLMFGGKIKDFGYQLGLRAENTISTGDLKTTQTSFNRNYFGWFPSASFSQKLGAAEEIQMSYSRRINRPSHQELNPFVNTSDPLNYFSGNPDLKPEYTNSFEMNFIKYINTFTITPGLFYRYTKDELSRTRTLIDSNTTLTTFTNYGSSKTYGAELIVSATLFEFWNLNGSGSYYNTDVDAENLQQGFVNDGYTWNGRINSNMRFPGIVDVMFSYFYSGKIIVAQGELSPFQSFDISLKKDFWDNQASVSLRVSDVFNKLKFNVLLSGSQFNENFFRKRDTRQAFLSFTYKFGQSDKNEDRKRRRDSNQDNNNDGMGF